MKMTREQMMDSIINQYGFEDFHTIAFCIIAENANTPDADVINLYNSLNREG